MIPLKRILLAEDNSRDVELTLAAAAFGVRALPARVAFAGVAANPILVWARVILRVEFRRRQLIAHRAPPENPKTKTMCSAVKISSP